MVSEYNSFGIKDGELQEIVKFFEGTCNVFKVSIFGSRAMNTFKDYSDIDLAIYGTFSEMEIAKLRGDLEELSLPYQFDIVAIPRTRFQPLINHIEKFERVIFLRNK